MKILQLWLINFRNYANTSLDFQENNLIVGPNGAGKTSILEAIDLLSTTKSKIVKGINKCIRHEQNGFIVTGKFKLADGQVRTINFKQEKNSSRTIKLDGQFLAKSSELIGAVNSVIFLPNDIDIIQGSPAVRRKYLDILISQLEKEYYRSLQDYQKILKQRNELLKLIKIGAQPQAALTVWEKQLAAQNKKIFLKRASCVASISRTLNELYKQMGFNEEILLNYRSEVSEDLEQNEEKLLAGRGYDIITGHTSFGVHGDDLEFLINEHRVVEHCSQGQQRLISIALKCAEADLKKTKLGDPPLLLIDDVLLELDPERFNKIIREIAPESQKIFTVTDTRRFEKELLTELPLIRVEQGQIISGNQQEQGIWKPSHKS